jgi:hypothetical protein
MDPTRAPAGVRVAAAGAAALLVFMFLPWFSADQVVELSTGSVSAPGETRSAWGAFSLVDLLLALSALVTLALAAAAAYDVRLNLPAPPGLVIAALGCFAVLLIVVRLIVPPEITTVVGSEVHVETGRKIGIVLGLLAAFAMTAGGYLSLQDTSRR